MSTPFGIIRLALSIALLTGIALIGCAPATEEEPQAAVQTPAEMVSDGASDEHVGAVETKEGSDPKAEPFGRGLVAKAEDAVEEAVDTSIRDAGEFGDDALVADLSPEGWSQTGNIEHYNVATLYEKINGRSELYMAYDVLGMSWVTFVDSTDANNFIDLFIYDMREPTNAFGIYSVEREADQPPADLGREGYRTGSNYYFWKGDYYGYINASMENDRNTKAGIGVATALMQRIVDDGGAVEGLDWLPAEGLVTDTVQFFKADAMSLDFLNDTFLGMYETGGSSVRAFVSKRADEAEAADILAQFVTYGSDYADGTEQVEVDGVNVVLTDWGGDFYDVAFHVGATVAGLSNVEGKDLTNSATAELIAKLKG